MRALREALALAPRNPTVLAAFAVLQNDANVPPISKLVHKFAKDNDEAAGKEAVRVLRDPNVSLQTSTAVEIVELLLPRRESDTRALNAQVAAEALKVSRGAREHVANKLAADAPGTLAAFEELGEEAVDAVVGVLMDPMAWTKAAANTSCVRECFKILLVELSTGSPARLGKPCIAKSVARLLTGKAEELHSFLNQEGLEQLLVLTDITLPLDLRSHATLAVAKFVETSEELALSMIGKFVAARLGADGDDDLRLVFSMAAAIFPLVPQVASQLFLAGGFVEGLVEMLQARPVEVEAAALEMLSCACVEKTCRTAIATHCSPYLESLLRSNSPGKSTAAIVLAKVKYGTAEPGKAGEQQEMDELAGVFKEFMLKGDTESMDSSVEGLAYTSLKGSVKSTLIKDPKVVKGLINTLQSAAGKPTVMFGALTVVANLTAYPPTLTEEQQKVAQLKNYAEAKGGSKPGLEPEDAEDRVTARCKALIDANLIPALVTCSKKITPNAIFIISNILLSLSKHQKHRGTIASQGAVRLCLQFFSSTSGDSELDRTIKQTSAHALARILVSVNPSHVFSSALTISTPVRPLFTLFDNFEDRTDLLPVFETLLALTNLASAEDSVRQLIIRMGWTKIEELLLSQNAMIQRATVELICNLMASPQGVALYADGSKAADNRLHILLALADSEDFATRRAAGGALAMLTEWDMACKALVERESGVKVVLELVAEESEEMRHRGVVILRNLVFCEGGWAKKVKEEGAEEVLTRVLRETRQPDILQVGVEALKVLREC